MPEPIPLASEKRDASRRCENLEALAPGEVERIGPDEYRLTRLTPPPNRYVVEWLRPCPEHEEFVEVESESTDSL